MDGGTSPPFAGPLVYVENRHLNFFSHIAIKITKQRSKFRVHFAPSVLGNVCTHLLHVHPVSVPYFRVFQYYRDLNTREIARCILSH